MVARLVRDQEAMGSNPVTSTNTAKTTAFKGIIGSFQEKPSIFGAVFLFLGQKISRYECQNKCQTSPSLFARNRRLRACIR